MSKTIAIVGFGPGTSTAVAEKFGKEGFSVALIGRDEGHLAAGVAALKAQGIDAFASAGDAADSASIRAAIRSVRSHFGGITVLEWTAYGGMDAGDLLTADDAALHGVFDVAVFGLLAALDEALPDLKADGNGALLISNGAFGLALPPIDAAAVNFHVMGLALACAAKDKLAGLLAERVKGDGVYVGEVMVHGTIKGTPSTSNDSIDPSIIADKHFELYKARSETRAEIK